MRLSDFKERFSCIINDGEFSTLGNITSNPSSDYLSYAENKVFLIRACKKENISCILCSPELADCEEIISYKKGIAICNNPRLSFYELNNWLAKNNQEYSSNQFKTTIGTNSYIHPSAIISERGVRIGNDVIIEENVVIKAGVNIGDRVTIGSGAIIGGENHIIAKDEKGNLFLATQTGTCSISNDVSIGYRTFIARGSFPYDCTYVGPFTKIEAGVEISHNSHIGANCIITGQTQICGNAFIGDKTRINPQAVVSNQITVGEDVTIDIGSVVVSNVKDHMKVAGNFAIEHMKFLLWHRKKLSGK